MAFLFCDFKRWSCATKAQTASTTAWAGLCGEWPQAAAPAAGCAAPCGQCPGFAPACRIRRPALHGQHRAADGGEFGVMFQLRGRLATATRRSSPRRRSRVGVVFGRALLQVGVQVGQAGLLNAVYRDVRPGCGASTTSPAVLLPGSAACSRAMLPPSLWPNSQGGWRAVSTPSAASSAGSTSSARRCMKSGCQCSVVGRGWTGRSRGASTPACDAQCSRTESRKLR